MVNTLLSAIDLRNLRLIGQIWVCASYWEDPTIRQYRQLGFVYTDGARIRLTEDGRGVSKMASPVLASTYVTVPVAGYHPI